LSAGHQEQIYDRLAQLFLPSAKQKKKWHQAKPTRQEAAEMWRTLANLERLPIDAKQKLGGEVVRRITHAPARDQQIHDCALGRIGSRVPLYGPLNAVVPTASATRWIEAVVELEWPDPEKAAFSVAQLARKTGDRARDIDESLRARLLDRLGQISGAERTAR